MFNTSFDDNNENNTFVKISDLRHPISIVILLTLAYSLVFVLGVIGNILVVSVVWRGPGMRSPTNLFIANLACADLLVIFICLPFTLISNILVEWKFGWFICKTVPYMQGVSVNASINTLVAISAERCVSICRPLKGKITTSTVKLVIVTIWLFSLTITLPWALVFQLQPLGDSKILGCLEMWPSPYSDSVYFVVVNLIMCYLFPLSIITWCYLMIWRRVCYRKLPGEPHASGQHLIQKSKVKVIKMLLIVIVLFAFSWLPFYIVFTRIKLGSQLDPSNKQADFIIYSMIPVAQWLGSSNSCINPILYAFFNKKFRTGFKAVLSSGSWRTPIASQSRRSPKYQARKTIASQTPKTVQASKTSNNLRSVSLRTNSVPDIKLYKNATFV